MGNPATKKRAHPVLRGAASLFDFAGALLPTVQPPRPRSHADDRAGLARDWKRVGGDISVALDKGAPRTRG